MWEETKIEQYLNKLLKSEQTKEDATFYYNLFTSAKQYLCDKIFNRIAAVEPGLTDHSEKHAIDVLNLAWKLILKDEVKPNYKEKKQKESPYFNEIEILLLCVSILFHDAGNIHGRTGHSQNIADIYNEARHSVMEKCRQERQQVLRIVRAHSGMTSRGDNDTLRDIEESSNLFDAPIKLRELAAILRFADELAEGPQRTSQYMIDKGLIEKPSLLYHYYSSITNIHVDKGNERIALTYNIDYPINTKDITLDEILKYVYTRILKLDSERRYCKYYAPSLSKYKRTEATISFTINGNLCDLILPMIRLEDKYSLVEENIEYLLEQTPALKIDVISEKLENLSSK